MSDSVQPQRRQPTRLPRPWDSPGKNTGVGCHFLLQCMRVKSESEVASHSRLLAMPWTAAYQAPLSMDFPGKSTGVGCHCLLRQLWQAGLYASCHMGSSQTRDQTHVSCIGSQIFYDWTTGKPSFAILISPRVVYLNFPASQNIKMKKKPLFSIVVIIHDVPLEMLSSKLSRTTLTLTEVLTCLPSEKAWLRPGKPITSPKALPLLPK